MDENRVREIEGDYEHIETHISWVLLDKKNVYKIKKPVQFSFLDFSTLEKRKFSCEEEIRLNSRLSPDVYLSVVRIVDDGSKLRFSDSGKAMEYAVKMVRLSEQKKMNNLLRQDKIGEKEIKELARTIGGFHKSTEAVHGEYNSPKLIGSQISDLGNFRVIIEKASGLGEWVDRILINSAAFIKRNEKLLQQRMDGGFVRDGHGDLHSGNVFFENGIRIIDCIEFNKNFRCIDVASDVAFMAMDLDYAGRDDLSELFIDKYLSITSDNDLEELLPFYKCYRANVRAKIAAIEWHQKPGYESREKIDRYVLLAERYAKGL